MLHSKWGWTPKSNSFLLTALMQRRLTAFWDRRRFESTARTWNWEPSCAQRSTAAGSTEGPVARPAFPTVHGLLPRYARPLSRPNPDLAGCGRVDSVRMSDSGFDGVRSR